MFITAFTSARHLFPSWASSIKSIPLHPTSWRSTIPLSSHLGLGFPSGSFPQVSPLKPFVNLSPPPHVLHAPDHFFFWFDHPQNIGWAIQIIKFLICRFLHSPVTSFLLAQIFASTPNSQTTLAYVTPSKWAAKLHNHTKQQVKLNFCIS
jgi:hypothetical protein